MRIVTFGEIMGRIAPPHLQRWVQALPGTVEFTFGGSEANVAVSLASFRADVSFVTALPHNAIADACVRYLMSLGVDTSWIVRTPQGRLGLYYLEEGANQRSSVVVYDRAGSSVSLEPPEAYNWPAIFKGAGWFHVSGITPALSRHAADATSRALQTAKERGLTVSLDLNIRKKLWTWNPDLPAQQLAERTLRSVLPLVHVLIASAEHAAFVLGAPLDVDQETGAVGPATLTALARSLVHQFPNLQKVSFPLRESLSASHNLWGGYLYEASTDTAWFAPRDANGQYDPYVITHIVDRVGAGDAFAAGLIFALVTPELADGQRAVAFATAASCLKHSIPGDMNFATRSEVETLMKGQKSGRVQR